MASLASVTIDRSHQWRLPRWTDALVPSAVQEMLQTASGPGFVSFALGMPAAEFLPNAACTTASRWVLESSPDSLQYRPPLDALKERIVALMRRRGLECWKEQIVITTGAQQGLNLMCRLLIERGAPVLVEEALYPGFRQPAESCEARFVPVATDPETGIDVDAVGRILAGGLQPALIYINGGAHNPLGISMSAEKKAALVKLAAHYQVPIVEDDAYGLLSFDDRTAPPLRAIDDQIACYVGSLSKIMAPALRIGWIVAPEWATPKLATLKEGTDLDTCALSQRIATRLFDILDVNAHIDNLISAYRCRRDVMLRALEEEFAEFGQWQEPSGGMFAWIRLAGAIDTGDLLRKAIETERIAYLPGYAFSVEGGASLKNCLRLTYSNLAPDRIQDGIHRLAVLLKSQNKRGCRDLQ
jgi:2-aminoadipate transaminase